MKNLEREIKECQYNDRKRIVELEAKNSKLSQVLEEQVEGKFKDARC